MLACNHPTNEKNHLCWKRMQRIATGSTEINCHWANSSINSTHTKHTRTPPKVLIPTWPKLILQLHRGSFSECAGTEPPNEGPKGPKPEAKTQNLNVQRHAAARNLDLRSFVPPSRWQMWDNKPVACSRYRSSWMDPARHKVAWMAIFDFLSKNVCLRCCKGHGGSGSIFIKNRNWARAHKMAKPRGRLTRKKPPLPVAEHLHRFELHEFVPIQQQNEACAVETIVSAAV